MQGTGRTNLLANGTGTGVPFWENPIDFFEKTPWRNHINHVEEYFDIPADNQTATRGTVTVIQVDRRGDVLTDCWLTFTRAAYTLVTNTESMATMDWEAYQSIENIILYYNNKQVWRITGDKLVMDIKEKCSREERASLARLGLGDLTAPERASSASTPQGILWASLRVPWEKLSKAIHMVGLPNKLRFEILWKPANEVLFQATTNAGGGAGAGTTGGGITNINLRCKFTHLPEQLRNKYFMMSQSETGLRNKIITHEIHRRETITTSSNTSDIVQRLTNVRNDVIFMKIILRESNNVTSQQYLDQYRFLPFRVRMQDNGSDVTTKFEYNDMFSSLNVNASISTYASYSFTAAFAKYKDALQMYPNIQQSPFDNVGKLLFCPSKLYAMSEDNCFGSRNIGRYNNPQLVLSQDAYVSTQLEWQIYGTSGRTTYTPFGQSANTGVTSVLLDIYAEIHNVLIQKKGDLRIYLL